MGEQYENIERMNIPNIWVPQSPNVSFFCYFSSGVQTFKNINLDSDYKFKRESQEYVSGDGTLTLEELEVCQKLAAMNAFNKYDSVVHEIGNSGHINVLKNHFLINHIIDYITQINQDF